MLQNIILKAWPDQCEERRREQEALLSEQETTLPLFVVDIVLFPNMRLPLHIFEPRYRLMLRRCLEGSRRFGVVPIMGTEIAKVGTTAVIDHHVRLPDGRSLVSTRGGRRFSVLDTWEQDGYKLGRVQYIDEKESPVDPCLESIPEEELTPEQRSQLDAQRDMERLFRLAKETVHFRIGPALPDIQEKFGTMPEDDAVSFSFWLASLLPIPVQVGFCFPTKLTRPAAHSHVSFPFVLTIKLTEQAEAVGNDLDLHSVTRGDHHPESKPDAFFFVHHFVIFNINATARRNASPGLSLYHWRSTQFTIAIMTTKMKA